MPNWKKVIVSGSDAVLNSINVTTTGSFMDGGISLTSSDSSYSEIYVDGNITASGDIVAEGNIIAHQYIVSSSTTYMTQSFSDGSTIFGDDYDSDTHQFTGSLFITGITYDDTPQPAAAVLVIDTASGQLYYTGSYGGGSGEDDDWYIDSVNSRLTSSLNVFVKGQITASGYISSSTTIWANDFRSRGKKVLIFNETTNVANVGYSGGTKLNGPITASNIFSSSAEIHAKVPEDVLGSYNNVVVYDQGTGRFFHTGSYGGSNVAGTNTQVQINNNGSLDASSNLTFGKTDGNLRVGISDPQNIAQAGYGKQSGSHFLEDNDALITNAKVPKWSAQTQFSENYVFVGFGGGGATDPATGTSYSMPSPENSLGAGAFLNNSSPILSGLSDGQGGQLPTLAGKTVNGELKIGGIYANYRTGAGWVLYSNQFVQVPGSPGIAIRGGGIELYSSESYTSDSAGSGSLLSPRASASAVFTLADDSSSLAIQVGEQDLRDVMLLSRSGDNPQIGIGTREPLTSLDIRSITASDPANIILRTNEDGVIEAGEETGRIIFAIESSSYLGTDFISSGSTAAIFSRVKEAGASGAYGSLIFEVNDNDERTKPFEILELGYGVGGFVNGQAGARVSGSLEVSSEFPTLNVKNPVNGNSILYLGPTTADILSYIGGGDAIDRGNFFLYNDGDVKIRLNTTGDSFINDGNNLGIGTENPESKLHVAGDIQADGNIIANQYIVSSSVTYTTQSFSSGSTIFGDTSDDTHQFTGSLDVTGSLTLNQGGLKVFLDSGSAFEVDEPDIDLGGRFKFSYSQGDPTLSVISRSSTSIFKLVANNESGDGLTLTEDGLIQKNGTKGVVVNEDDFYPNTNNNVALGRSNRQWTDIYATGIWYGDGANNLFSIGGTQRADGKYNGGLVYFGFADDGTGAPFTSSLRNPDLHFLGIGSNNGAQNSLHNEAPVYFKVGKSGSLSINLDQGETGMGGDGFKFYTASAMVHVEAEPSWNMDLFRGDKTVDDIRFRVDREGNTTISGSLTASDLNYPNTDGDNGDVLITDGAGNLSFARTTVYANVKNVHGSELVKGMPVHVTGAAGNTSEVIAASASNAATMPAHFILNETLADDAEGLAIAVGYINQVNTGDFNEGDTVYVGADGGYTNVKPTGSNLIQNLGIVDKVDASNGSGFILGAGRSNDVPNISPGYVWVGNNSSVATAVATSSLSVATASFVGSIHGGTF